ncbi:hypothetical protein ABO04_10315 [Nitrosomonas sp. HPC101]|nr:hypothetical protein [Nitrosomonas sp. HPC101]
MARLVRTHFAILNMAMHFRMNGATSLSSKGKTAGTHIAQQEHLAPSKTALLIDIHSVLRYPSMRMV